MEYFFRGSRLNEGMSYLSRLTGVRLSELKQTIRNELEEHGKWIFDTVTHHITVTKE